MYRQNLCNESDYSNLMDAIKKLNLEKQVLQKNEVFKKYQSFNNFWNSDLILKKMKIMKKINLNEWRSKNVLKKYSRDLPTAFNDRTCCDYFSDSRIAVYTCIIGKYDNLLEPLIVPDNIDYFAITDFPIPETSKWKWIDANSFEEVKDFSPTLTNRFFKINPHKIFPQYKYSIYVDGNIRIYTDFTEHINRMSKYGFSHFRHSKRTNVFQEAEACKALKKETEENIDLYIERLKSNGFPSEYGLLACNILAREHNNPTCISIMEQWWYEFSNYVKRDQLSLPFVLYKNKIKVDEVATLGGNVYKDYSFEIVRHI